MPWTDGSQNENDDKGQPNRANRKIRKYRTEIPNYWDDLAKIAAEDALDPFCFRLLVHYIRRGSCWETAATTAHLCLMSRKQVFKKREWLKRHRYIEMRTVSAKELRDLGYNIPEHARDGQYSLVIPVPINWEYNLRLYQKEPG